MHIRSLDLTPQQRLVSGKTYRGARETLKRLGRKLPRGWFDKARKTEKYGRAFSVGGSAC